MDPLQQVQQEMARRGLAGLAGSGGGGGLAAFGIPGAVGQPQPAPQPGMGMQILGAAVKAIPRAGALVRSVNAGPVADGTLEYARRMGWVR